MTFGGLEGRTLSQQLDWHISEVLRLARVLGLEPQPQPEPKPSPAHKKHPHLRLLKPLGVVAAVPVFWVRDNVAAALVIGVVASGTGGFVAGSTVTPADAEPVAPQRVTQQVGEPATSSQTQSSVVPHREQPSTPRGLGAATSPAPSPPDVVAGTSGPVLVELPLLAPPAGVPLGALEPGPAPPSLEPTPEPVPTAEPSPEPTPEPEPSSTPVQILWTQSAAVHECQTRDLPPGGLPACVNALLGG